MSNSEDFNLPKPIMLTGASLDAARRYRDLLLEKQARYEALGKQWEREAAELDKEISEQANKIAVANGIEPAELVCWGLDTSYVESHDVAFLRPDPEQMRTKAMIDRRLGQSELT